MIGLRLSHIGSFEFHRAEEAIRLGAEQAWRRAGLAPSRLGAEAAERSLDTIAQAPGTRDQAVWM